MRYLKIKLVIILAICNLVGFHALHRYQEMVAGGDSWGYYAHLPSTFIYHDVGDYHRTVAAGNAVLHTQNDVYSDKYAIVHRHPNGKYNIKYTNGVALMLLPFFLLAHIFVLLTNISPADGFSMPYLLAIGWGVIVWTSVANYFLITVLRRYFSQTVTATSLIAITLATNLLHNVVYTSIMSHAFLFTCYALLIYHTDTYYRQPTQRRLIWIAMSAAMITLLRLNEIYCILIPLLWNVCSFQDLTARFRWIGQHFSQYLLAAASGFCILLPQIIYWKILTGDFIYYAYVGETFDFKHSHIWDGWFSYRNGWLVWSPVMIGSILGIFWTWRNAKAAFVPLVLLLSLHAYVIYSWWCFTYINGFGSRPMEDIYPLLAFAMASWLTVAFRRVWTSGVVGVFIGCCILLNMFQIWQQSAGLLVTDMMSEGYYWEMFCQPKIQRVRLLLTLVVKYSHKT
jgi:hypothetical protein